MNKILSLAVAGTVALCAGAASAQTKWDLPAAYPASNFHTKNLVEFANDVRRRTGGKIEITVHPGASLFKGNDIKRAVQTGQAPIGERLMSAHANENRGVRRSTPCRFSRPSFAAPSQAVGGRHAERSRRCSTSRTWSLLYAVPWPPQGIYTKKDINSLERHEGRQVPQLQHRHGADRRAGRCGQPVQIEAAELSQALATGVVESFISSGSTGYDSKVWEQLTHFYEVNAWLPRNYVFANKDAWEDLDDATRTAIQEAARAAEERGTAKAEELTKWYLEQLAANGMKVQPPGETLAADLDKVGETMTAEWVEAAGADGKAIVGAYGTP